MNDITLVLVVLLIIVLLYRGPKMLPRLGESFGKMVRGARRAADERFDGPTDAAVKRDAADRASTANTSDRR